MSDAPQGPGWWQAADGRWYPPDQAPGWAPPPTAAWSAGAVPIGGALDVGAGISWAWDRFKADAGTFVLLALVPMLVMTGVVLLSFVALVPGMLGDLGMVLGFVLLAVVVAGGIVVSFVMSRGLYRAALGVCDGRPPDVGLLFAFDGIGPFIVVSLLYGLAVLVGTLLCIIPGIIAAVAFVWAPYAVIDHGLAPMDAMRRSWDLTRARAGEVVLYLLVVYALNAVVTTVCGLLALVTAPLMWLALAYAWRRLNGQPVAA